MVVLDLKSGFLDHTCKIILVSTSNNLRILYLEDEVLSKCCLEAFVVGL